jgi:hypothetical protein
VWAPEPVWTQRLEKKTILLLPGIETRSPGCPARSQTLYWLSYPAHQISPHTAKNPLTENEEQMMTSQLQQRTYQPTFGYYTDKKKHVYVYENSAPSWSYKCVKLQHRKSPIHISTRPVDVKAHGR